MRVKIIRVGYLERIHVDLEGHESKRVLFENEYRQRLTALGVDGLAHLVVLERTHESLKLTQQRRENEAEKYGRYSATNEALPGLFRRELDESCATEKETKHIGHDVVADDQRNGQQEPDETLEHVLNHKIRLRDD